MLTFLFGVDGLFLHELRIQGRLGQQRTTENKKKEAVVVLEVKGSSIFHQCR